MARSTNLLIVFILAMICCQEVICCTCLPDHTSLIIHIASGCVVLILLAIIIALLIYIRRNSRKTKKPKEVNASLKNAAANVTYETPDAVTEGEMYTTLERKKCKVPSYAEIDVTKRTQQTRNYVNVDFNYLNVGFKK